MRSLGTAMHAAALALENLLQTEATPDDLEPEVRRLMETLYDRYEDHMENLDVAGATVVPGGAVATL